MITGAAFCPQAPVLVPEIASGAACELAATRAACRTAVARVARPGQRIVVIGSAPTSAFHPATARGSFAGFGVALEVSLGADGPGPATLPPALAVGAWLVRDALGPGSGAVGYSIGPDFAQRPDLADWAGGPAPVTLIVVGDASARRTAAAPGYLDPRAVPFDAAVAGALATGDAAALAGLDPMLADELLVAGAPAWRAAGAELRRHAWDAELLDERDPYGVGYLVAAWTVRD